MYADWVAAVAIVAVLILGTVVTRLKLGHRRHIRISLTFERHFEGAGNRTNEEDSKE